MVPFSYTISSSYRDTIKPTIEAVLAYLKENECPAYVALHRRPVRAHFADGTEEYVDFTPYTESCEPTSEQRQELEGKLDRYIADCEVRWAKIQARLKPGERYVGFSGEKWIFKSDREKELEYALREYRVKWRS